MQAPRCGLSPHRFDHPVRSVSRVEPVHGPVKVLGAEIRPRTIGEVELGVGGLPEQEVRQATLAAGADDEIDRGCVEGVEFIGEEIFINRCGSCHTLHDTNSLVDVVEGMSGEELDEFFSDLERDYMPPFTGTDEQRRALADWLAAQAASTGQEVSR